MSVQKIYISNPGFSIPEKNQETPKQDSQEFLKVLQQESGHETKKVDAKVKTNTLNFSAHAENRIRSRAINWDEKIEKRISEGMDRAVNKGSREALIIADQLAVIANVNSRTVITAMHLSQMREKVFTNIDSTVIV